MDWRDSAKRLRATRVEERPQADPRRDARRPAAVPDPPDRLAQERVDRAVDEPRQAALGAVDPRDRPRQALQAREDLEQLPPGRPPQRRGAGPAVRQDPRPDRAAPPLAVRAGAGGGAPCCGIGVRDRLPPGALLQRLVGLPVDGARQRDRHVRAAAPERLPAGAEGAVGARATVCSRPRSCSTSPVSRRRRSSTPPAARSACAAGWRPPRGALVALDAWAIALEQYVLAEAFFGLLLALCVWASLVAPPRRDGDRARRSPGCASRPPR